VCLELLNVGMAKEHLKAAQWHAGEAKKAIALVGQSLKPKGQP
jgi:hypothetical protein